MTTSANRSSAGLSRGPLLARSSGLALALALAAIPSAGRAQVFDYDAYAALFGEPVTQGVTGAPMRASQSPFSVSIITQDEIAASPSPDIAGLLDHLAGVSDTRREIGQADIGIRGFEQPKPRGLLVLVNGRQVYLDSYGSTDWEAIPVTKEEIKQIEVIRGPNGALYGFNAAEGVINIITDDPLYDKGSFILEQHGTQDDNRLAAGITVPITDRGGVRLTADSEGSDEFLAGMPDNPANATDREHFTTNLDAAYKLNDTLTARVEMSHAEINHSEIGPLYGPEDNKFHTNSIKADLTNDLDDGSLHGSFYLNTLWDGPVDNEVWVGQGEYLRKLAPRHTIRFSAEYRTNRTRQRGTGIEFGIEYDVYSAGVMWDWEATNTLSFVNAVRLDQLELHATMPPPDGTPYTRDDYSQSHTETSFNSAAVWQADDRDQFRLSVARGAQIPSLVDFGMAAGIPDGSGGTALFIGGDPSNKITTVWNYEFGFRRAIPEIRASLDADIFHMTRHDVIAAPGGYPDTFGPGPIYLFTNRGDMESTGIEVSLRGTIGKTWHWSLNYANIDVNDDITTPVPASFPIPGNVLFPTDFEDVQPRHVANAVVTYEGRRFLATIGAHYQSDSREKALTASGFQLQDIQAYVDAEAKLSYRLTDHVSLSFEGTNLLTDSQKESSVGEVERRLLVTLSAHL